MLVFEDRYTGQFQSPDELIGSLLTDERIVGVCPAATEVSKKFRLPGSIRNAIVGVVAVLGIARFLNPPLLGMFYVVVAWGVIVYLLVKAVRFKANAIVIGDSHIYVTCGTRFDTKSNTYGYRSAYKFSKSGVVNLSSLTASSLKIMVSDESKTFVIRARTALLRFRKSATSGYKANRISVAELEELLSEALEENTGAVIVKKKRRTLVAGIVAACIVLVIFYAAGVRELARQQEVIDFASLFSDPIFQTSSEVPRFPPATLHDTKLGLLDVIDRVARFDPASEELDALSAQLLRRLAEQAKSIEQLIVLTDAIALKGEGIFLPEVRAIVCGLDSETTAEDCRPAVNDTADKWRLGQVKRDIEKLYWDLYRGRLRLYSDDFSTLLDDRLVGDPGLEPKLALDFDECWCTSRKQDLIEIQNLNEFEWTDVIVRVRVFSRGNEFVDNWHVVERVSPRESLFAGYPHDTGYVRQRTFNRVGRIEVDLWASNLARQSYTYSYSGKEQDRDIERRLADLKATDLDYLKYEEIPFWPDNQRGLSFGLSAPIPIPHEINIEFTNNRGQRNSARFRQDSWRGNHKKFRTQIFKFRPSKIAVRVSFDQAGSDFVFPLGNWAY